MSRLLRVVLGILVGVASVGYAVYAVARFGLPAASSGLELAAAGAAGLLASPQFFAFVVAPAWLWFTVGSLGQWLSPIRLLRHGSRVATIGWCAAKSALVLTLGLAGVVAIAGLATIVASPLSEAIDQDSVAVEMQDLLPTSLITVMAHCFLWTLALSALTSLLCLAAMTRYGRWLPGVLGVVAWLWIVVSTTGFLPSGHWGNAATYLDGVTLVLDPLASAAPVAVGAGLIAVSVLGAAAIDARVRRRLRSMSIRHVLLLVVVGSVVAIATRDSARDSSSFAQALAVPLHSGGTIVQLLGAVVFSTGLAALLLAERSDELNGWQRLVAIREGSWWRIWRAAILARSFSAACFVAALLLVGTLVFYVTNPVPVAPDFPGIALVTYQWFVLGALQLTFAALVAWSLQTLGCGEAVSLAVLAVIGIAGGLTTPLSDWLPFPFTTGSTRFGDWGDALTATFACILWIGAVGAGTVYWKHNALRRRTV